MKNESNRGLASRRLLVMVSLLTLSTPAWAPAPVYFDLGGLLLLIAGFFALVVMGAGWMVAGGSGVAWSVGLLLSGLVASVIWANWSGYKSESEHAAWKAFAYGACHTRDLLKLPDRAIQMQKAVVILPGDLWLRDELHFRDGQPAAGVELAGVFPQPRSEGTAYVRIISTVEDVPDTKNERLRGLNVRVQDHTGADIAQLRDYHLGHWCSGSTPSDRIERFLRAAIGRTVGLSLKWHTAERLRSKPRAVIAALLLPADEERVLQSSTSSFSEKLDDKTLMQKLGFPATAQCRQKHEWRWICMEDTPEANEFAASRPGHSVVHEDRWLTFNCDTSHCGSSPYRIDERDIAGRLVAVWHVGMPAEFVRSTDFASELLGMELAGDTLSLKLGRREERSSWDDKRTTTTYGDIKIARVELDRRLLLPPIPSAESVGSDSVMR